jgi:hypothetical protein
LRHINKQIKNAMKKTFTKALAVIIIIATMTAVTSCSTVIDLGKLNMISDRNIDSKMDYVLIKNYAGGSKKEIKKGLKRTKTTSLDIAVDETVKNVAGGEFLKNVRVYGLKKRKKMYLLVEGDVWGVAGNESFRGFKLGDIVQWKELGVTHKGTITGLTDATRCMVKEDGKENSVSLKFASITKVSE